MKRDFKLSSVLLIQILSGLVIGLLSALLRPSIDSYDITGLIQIMLLSSLPLWLITSLVRSVTGFTIARGLLKDRMGSVGEYLNKIGDFTMPAFGVLFISQIIIVAVPIALVIIFVPIIIASIMTSEGFSAALFILFIVLAMVLSIVLEVFSYFSYFVVADRPNISKIGSTIKQIFRTSKDLMGESIKAFFKYIIIPVIVYLVVMALAQTGKSGGALIGGIATTISIIGFIAAVAYAVVIKALLYGEFSNLYLDYVEGEVDINREF